MAGSPTRGPHGRRPVGAGAAGMARRLRGGSQEWVGRVRAALELAAPRRYLFVMSHMRSYSSLLCHILNSHSDMAGYVEMHKAYVSNMDLFDLVWRVRESNGQRLSGRYVVDKLLHNHAEVRENVLVRDDVYTLFTVREPQQTIRSIIAMGLKRQNLDWKSEPPKVVNYYVKRLQRLNEMAAMKKGQSMFLEADRLINDTDASLVALGSFLKLGRPLRSTYDTFEFTGKPRFGDPSRFISSGQIVSERDDYSHIEVPDKLMARAQHAYDESRELLSGTCEQAVAGR
ncbi:MAG: hypothetical protein H0V19_00340 [Euzebyales bacterium]|nr:hypothetical protein [Euzebyales bacterium]MDQ3406106.1 hypothetical protein [Actinomycetota bacterium]